MINIRVVIAAIGVFSLMTIGSIYAQEIVSNASAEKSQEELQHEVKLKIEEGRELYSRRKYKAAIMVYEEVIEKYPSFRNECAWALYDMGFTYYKKRKYQNAEKYFSRVISEYPENRGATKLADNMINKIQVKKQKRMFSILRKKNKKTEYTSESAPDIDITTETKTKGLPSGDTGAAEDAQ